MNSFERVKLVTKTMDKFSLIESGKYIHDANLFETLEELIDEVIEAEETERESLMRSLIGNTGAIALELANISDVLRTNVDTHDIASAVEDLGSAIKSAGFDISEELANQN